MNHATENMSLETLRQRLEAAYDRKDEQETMALSRMIDRLSAQHLQAARRL